MARFEDKFSERQQEVLAAALDLMVEEGDGFTMRGVAERANCSKETLYKWFGDRTGLLTATVRWQAAKVRLDPSPEDGIDKGALSVMLKRFAENWLKVLSGDISIALNRLAVSHAGTGRSELGSIVLENGPFAMAERLAPVLEAGRDAGVLDFESTEAAFRTFFGLVVRDMQIRLLLGDEGSRASGDPEKSAARAVDQFFALHGSNAMRGASQSENTK
ncbi:MAG: TetR/AcrR family transcriptional regulator [Pseudomonadota bacterium]